MLSTNRPPFDVGGISPLQDGNSFVDDKFPILSLDCVMELSMSRAILEHV